jgi:hypothetical protein
LEELESDNDSSEARGEPSRTKDGEDLDIPATQAFEPVDHDPTDFEALSPQPSHLDPIQLESNTNHETSPPKASLEEPSDDDEPSEPEQNPTTKPLHNTKRKLVPSAIPARGSNSRARDPKPLSALKIVDSSADEEEPEDPSPDPKRRKVRDQERYHKPKEPLRPRTSSSGTNTKPQEGNRTVQFSQEEDKRLRDIVASYKKVSPTLCRLS